MYENISHYIDACDAPKVEDPIISVVITSRAEAWPILCMTLQNIQENLNSSRWLKGRWECLVVFNSNEEDKDVEGETRFKECNLRKFGAFRYVRTNEPSSSIARSAGVYEAIGDYVYIGDSHQIFGFNFFESLIRSYETIAEYHPIGILHSALGWMSGVPDKDLCDRYTPLLKAKFWGNWHRTNSLEPHIICMKGTSFLMLRKYALEIGLWNLNFKPYGGNEPYLNLKVWRLGQEVWVDPRIYVWHLAYKRNYCWNNDILWFNTLLAAYTIGGNEWLEMHYQRYCTYIKQTHKEPTVSRYLVNLQHIKADVVEKGKSDMEWINTNAKYTLNELMNIYAWE